MTDEPMVTFSVPARYADAAKELLREDGWTARDHLAGAARWADVGYFLDAFDAACRAALLELADPPTLTVGELARDDLGAEFRVDYVGKRVIVLTNGWGTEFGADAGDLTPLGIPAPDDWGQK